MCDTLNSTNEKAGIFLIQDVVKDCLLGHSSQLAFTVKANYKCTYSFCNKLCRQNRLCRLPLTEVPFDHTCLFDLIAVYDLIRIRSLIRFRYAVSSKAELNLSEVSWQTEVIEGVSDLTTHQ